ncbi:cupin domain-containing protein [Chroococcidiopsis sp. FACHB-1243]|uniref:cupin domain-containing protein n=1 Tax=Chroococcidiopsis sp. [FACHB-1243] TaxID=2692781 RepID=UPI0017812C31|nr:cupin domain-containing protein [Chroococcidiopsis sp. [FACHB-1243]]MBD2309975.1 cupin domain-containing protein [Chroococcidiopsis sp. [FACHB-1243]]
MTRADSRCMIAVAKSPKEYQVYRISPDSSNKLAIAFDPLRDGVSFTCCVEIFDVGGKTPPNRHMYATELFFVLKGEGRATCDGKTVLIQEGDSLVVPPTGTHTVENIGKSRLYTLTVMLPNEDFAELIYNGIPVELDAEDLAVLQGKVSPILC